MSEKTIEEILVLYQMAVTGRPGPAVDARPSLTKDMADAIRRVMTVHHTSVTLTAGQLVTACGFAGLFQGASALPDSCTDEELEAKFTFEAEVDIYLADGDPDEAIVYEGLAVHHTDNPDLGYQPLEPDKWPHQDGEHS